MDLIVLTPGADLDALSSSYGVLKINPNAKLLKPLSLSKSAGKVFKDFQNLFKDFIIENPPKEIEKLILVDTHSLSRLENLKDLPKFKKLVIYDHHPLKENIEFEGIIDTSVGSATTLIVEEIKRKNIPLNKEEATLLLMGIYEDTGFFKYNGTSPRDLMMAAYLLEKGAEISTVRYYVEEKFTIEHLEIAYKLLQSIEYIKTEEGYKVALAHFKGEEYTPDIQNLLYQLKEFEANHLAGFFIIFEAGNKTYIFGRSLIEEFNVSKYLEKLGGGGHKGAGSLKLEGISAERVKKRLKDILTGKLRDISVKNFMSFPPLVIPLNTTVAQALETLSGYGFASAPVVENLENKKLVGVIYKKDLLRAERHLGGNTPLETILSEEFKYLTQEATVWQAEEILSKFGQKLIPIVNNEEEKKVIGVITRLDIFHSIIEELPEKETGKEKIKLPENIREFAKKVGELAEKLGIKAYIVGGVVRDILLQKPVWDLDIVVEGEENVDAIQLAKKVAEEYGVKVHIFEEFRTAHLKLGNLKVEFATARREKYEGAGAYPKVERASLKEDILRRDFTINTMAIALNPDNFERLIDYLGGREDLKKGLIRVLHSMSFIEDPIRILRALRFAGRFNFQLSKGTKHLLKQAVKAGVLKNAPKGRIANELRLAMREDNFLEILKLYRKYKILEQIFPKGFQWSMIKEEEIKELHKLLKEKIIETPYPGWLIFINLLLGLKKEETLKFLKELSAPNKVINVYQQLKQYFARIQHRALKASRPSELFLGLREYEPETLLIVSAYSNKKIKERILFFLKELRNFKANIDIKALKEKGYEGKLLGEKILEEKLRQMDEKYSETMP